MSKRKRLGTVRVALTDFVTMVTLTDKLRRTVDECAGERARLIEACEELQAKLRWKYEHHGATCEELRRLLAERAAIHGEIRVFDAAITKGVPGALEAAWRAMIALLPPDAAGGEERPAQEDAHNE